MIWITRFWIVEPVRITPTWYIMDLNGIWLERHVLGLSVNWIWSHRNCETYMWPKRDWERVTPIRKAPPVHTLPERVMWIGIYIPHSCYHLCSVCVCVHARYTMYQMHIHHMGHCVCWMNTVVMSNGKALCCELKTGHMKTNYYMWHPFTQQDKCVHMWVGVNPSIFNFHSLYCHECTNL